MLLLKTLNIIILILILSVLVVFTKHHNIDSKTKPKTWYEFEYQTDYRNPSEAQQRSSDAIDLFKEFKDSIYVDRYYNSSFALNIPLFTLTLPGSGRGVHSQAPITALNIGLH
jgi:hypothetical protein